MNTLKTALQPVISDISLDWALPGGVEILQTPANPAPIFPGEPLVIYGLLCDTVRMHNTLASVLQKGGGCGGVERRNPFFSQTLSPASSVDRLEDDGDVTKEGHFVPSRQTRADDKGRFPIKRASVLDLDYLSPNYYSDCKELN